MRGSGRQLFEQRIEPVRAAASRDLSASRSLRERVHLVLQQRVGALYFFVAHEQAFDALGDLVNMGCRGI